MLVLTTAKSQESCGTIASMHLDYQHSKASKRQSPVPIIMVCSFFLIGAGAYVMAQTTTPKIISPLPTGFTPKPQPFIQFFAPKKDPEELKQRIKQTVGDTWSNYSVFVKDYTSDFVMDVNGTIIYTAASINKIPILAVVYYLAQKGEVDLDQIITLQQQDIQDYGTGSIRYDPPGSTYSVKTLAQLMMQKSDNTAAYLLANYIVTMDKIQELITSWGLTQTDMVNNKTSNADIAILMEKMYKEKIANHALTQEMLAYFKDGDFEDRIPALLPDRATTYHKIGNAIGSIHDVGIVTQDKMKYYVGILTADISDEEEATHTAALISKTVYDFMQ